MASIRDIHIEDTNLERKRRGPSEHDIYSPPTTLEFLRFNLQGLDD